MAAGPTIIVAARTLAGNFVFGPQPLPANALVEEVREQAYASRPAARVALELSLLHGEVEVASAVTVGELVDHGDLLLTAVFRELPSLTLSGFLSEMSTSKTSRVPEVFRQMPLAVRADLDVARAAAGRNWRALRHADPRLRGSAELLAPVVRQTGEALQFAGAALRADPDLVKAAVKESGYALEYAHEDLRADKEIVLSAVFRHGFALQFAHESLRADRSVVAVALRENGYALQHANETLRADRSLVELAVGVNGLALEYACAGLRADRDLVVLAVRSQPHAIEHAAPLLKMDRVVIIKEAEELAAKQLQLSSSSVQAMRPPLNY